MLKAARHTLARVHSQVLQNVAVRLDLAFQAFFRRVHAGETPGICAFVTEDATTASAIRKFRWAASWMRRRGVCGYTVRDCSGSSDVRCGDPCLTAGGGRSAPPGVRA